ncbi:MAG TPA: TetR family transcriptional regulator [Anaerolineales bacterium]|nr:TetR family transcriptional regulator [Anaerolineales bacterium]
MSSNPSKQEEKLDPRVKRTRSLILASFSDLLAEKSFDSISVQDVTEKAQINRATFYAHFEDKYGLLDRWVQQQFRLEIETRVLNACHYTPDNLHTLIATVCEFLSKVRSDCVQSQRQFEPLIEKQVKNQIYELLSVWLGKMNTPVSTEIPATVAAWAIYGLASYWSHAKKRPALDKFVSEALPLVAVNLEQFVQTA